jgi:putative ABC transport system permease protein
MSPRDLVGFSWQALRGHRLRTGLSLLGVAIGVAAVVVLTALGEGARLYVVDQFASLGSNLLVVIPGRVETTGAFPGVGGVPHDLTLADAEAVARRLPQAEAVAPMSVGTEIVSRGRRSRQVAVIGSTAEFLTVRRLSMARGEFLPPEEASRGSTVAVLGRRVATELFAGEEPLGKVVRIGAWRMRVIGVLGQQGTSLGVDMDEVVIVPVATVMRMFNRTSLFRLLVSVRAHADLDLARRQVLEILTERHGELDVTALTEDAVLSTFSAILNALTLALAAIAAVSLSVAGIGIMNVMLVSVSERTREVGLLKALGVEGRQVLGVFLAESVMLSSAGGIVGLAAGYAAVRVLVRVYPALPATPPVWAVAAALGVSVAVGGVFGLMPARRATRLDPIAALARR